MRFIQIMLLCGTMACLVGCKSKGGQIDYLREKVNEFGQVIRDKFRVIQPDNPADAASLEVDAEGNIKVTSPASQRPPDPLKPETSTSRSLGKLVIGGGITLVAGVILLAMRMSGSLWIKSAPKGLGQGLVFSGIGLIAVAVAFDSNELYAVGVVVIGLLIMAVVAWKSNADQEKEKQKSVSEAVINNLPSSIIIDSQS